MNCPENKKIKNKPVGVEVLGGQKNQKVQEMS